MEAAIALDGLYKRYGSLTAVDGITLSIGARQLYGILGPNGAGKSTLIKLMTGLLEPDQGKVQIAGSMAGRHGSVGLCPQELVVWEELTVREQLLFIAAMHQVPRRTAVRRAEELLAALGLAEKEHERAAALSGGMKRRLNMMLALMHDPDIVILDEPHAGLDPQSRLLVREFLKQLSIRKTVIVTTHDMEEVEKMADRVVIIDRGRVIAENTPDALKSAAFEGSFVEVSLTDPVALAEEAMADLVKAFPGLLLRAGMLQLNTPHPFELAEQLQSKLASQSIGVSDVRIRKPSLEDVFISMTGRGLRE